MPRLSRRRRTPFLAALLLLVAGGACARSGATTTSTTAATSRTIVVDRAPSDADDHYSVYDLPATWRDQQGAARTLASLRGRPQLVAMVYTHCATTCPLTVATMKRVERAADDAGLGFVLVSLDPARDSSAQLAAFAREHDLASARWTLLRGDDDAVRELAVALGVRYRRRSPDELAHSNTLTLLDASGAVAWQRAGLGAVDETVAAVRTLQR